jgi:hypothetical protein
MTQSPRINLRVPVFYRAGEVWGEGTSGDVSMSGALIEFATETPALDAKVEIWFSFFPGSTSVAVPARVVRHTDSGFGVTFIDLQDEHFHLLRQALPDGA